MLNATAPSLVSVALLVVGAGCVDAPANTSVDESEVYRDGTDWAADLGAHPQVVRLESPRGWCTGWLSSSNTITTNAHCLANTSDFIGWTYDPTMVNANPTQRAALVAMGPSTGGSIHPGGTGCPNVGPDCCAGADMAVLTFATAMPRTTMRPLRLMAEQADEPECSGSDTCVMMIGTGRTNGDVCLAENVTGSALDPSATQLLVESGLGDGHCPANGDMLYGEYDYDDSSFCKGDSGSPIIWRATDELMAAAMGSGGDGGDDVVGPVLWKGGPDTARDYYLQNAADRDADGIQAADDNCDQVWNPSQGDFNSDQIGDACQDSDADGLSDDYELGSFGTDPANPDTDGDGLRDGDERTRGTNPNDPDTDTDGLLDGSEVWLYGTDPLDWDTDDDELLDGWEIQISSPTNPDTDGDGLPDGTEVLVLHTNPSDPDTDHDGLGDRDEVDGYATDPLNPDTDSDGLPDGAELTLGTDPRNADSDGNGVLDGDEDPDADRLGDGFEVRHGTDPRNPDSDNDAVMDGQDVSWIGAAIATLASSSFAPSITPTTFAERLDRAEERTRLGDLTSARDVLDGLRARIDGCGAIADGADWLVECTSQLEIRALIDVVLANL